MESGKKGEQEEEEWIVGECLQIDFSLFSAEGMTQPRTMKLQGKMKGEQVILLIDGGANHNFISTGLVKKFGPNVHNTHPYCVYLGDGHKKGASGCCEDTKLMIGDYSLKETFFSLFFLFF